MKRLVKILIGLTVLLLLAVAVLLLWLDPNVFKPRIQAMAEQQGVHLTMDGDLSWRFWPSVGLELNKIAVASLEAPDQPIARLDSASLMVATAPLFSGELVVESLLVNGARVDVSRNAAGVANWESLMSGPPAASGEGKAAPEVSASAPEAKRDRPGEAQAIKLAIDAIELTQVEFHYRDERSETELAAAIDTLSLRGFNLERRPFALHLVSTLELTDAASFPQGPVQVVLTLNARMSIDQALSRFELTSSELRARLGSAAGTSELAVNFDMTAQDLLGDLHYEGELEIAPVNVRAVLTSLGQTPPQTAEPDALTALGLKAKLTGDQKQLALNDVVIGFDKTTFKGKLALTDFSRQAIELVLAGDQVNIDDYLPPVSDEVSAGVEAEVEASAGARVAAEDKPEEPLPLEALRGLNVQAKLTLQEAIVNKLKMANMNLTVSAHDGVLAVTDLSLDSYQGRLVSSAALDVRGEQAKANFQAKVAGVELAPMLKDMALDQNIQLTARSTWTPAVTPGGGMLQNWWEKLSADASFSGNEVVFAPINVEEYFCKVVAQLKDEKESEDGKVSADRQWPDKTPMRALEGRLSIRDQIVTVENFSAGVEHLLLSTIGSLNLARQEYDFRLPMTLLEESTSDMGCTVKSNYWLNRSLSLLRCKGSLANLSPLNDCGLDNEALESLLGDYAKARLQKELIRKLRGSDDADADGQSDTDKAVKGLLNSLFNKDKQ